MNPLTVNSSEEIEEWIEQSSEMIECVKLHHLKWTSQTDYLLNPLGYVGLSGNLQFDYKAVRRGRHHIPADWEQRFGIPIKVLNFSYTLTDRETKYTHTPTSIAISEQWVRIICSIFLRDIDWPMLSDSIRVHDVLLK